MITNLEKNIFEPDLIFNEYGSDIKTYLKTNQRKALLLFSGILSPIGTSNEPSVDTKTRKILTELRMSNSAIAFIERTLLFQKRALAEMQNLFNGDKNLRGIYSFVKGVGDELISSSLLASSIYEAENGECIKFNDYLYETYDFYINWFLPCQKTPALINGDDLTK